jgi:hypothetical protein
MLGVHVLVVAKPGQVARDKRFQDEEPVVSEMIGHVLTAKDLVFLGRSCQVAGLSQRWLACARLSPRERP